MEEGKNFPNALVCKNQLASLSVEERDYLAAIEIDTDKLKTDPTNHELYYDRSVCHYRLGKYQASLDDANAAIKLNPTVYNVHYQKGLALIGLFKFSEAVVSVKKAIELRARQDESKLSDIFNLLKYPLEEIKAVKERNQRTNSNPNNHTITSNSRATSNDPVDSTTDRPIGQAGQPVDNISPLDSVNRHGNNNLVANNNHQHQITDNANQVLGTTINKNRVSSSASLFTTTTSGNNFAKHTSSVTVSPDISSVNASQTEILLGPYSHLDQSKSAQFEWSIRRSERIFLHHTGEPGTSGSTSAAGQQFSAISPRQHQNINNNNNNDNHNNHHHHHHQQQQHNSIQQHNTSSNLAPISSCKSQKSSHDTHDSQAYHQSNRTTNNRCKDGTTNPKTTNNTHVESDIEVDDSHNSQYSSLTMGSSDPISSRKRLMIAPSSSMPATGQPNLAASAVPKDDSYSSKYKRLRRDRERARRGTSKLCTIKLSDLEELQKASNPSKRSMRVIAPIDGWLYSGQLSVDTNMNDNSDNGVVQYVVKLDGDSTGSSYLFTQETVLNDVIKEVRVKSVSELRKGARICCYWSRTYKCLSTGVVTSRTFEATKSLVSVKYDNGDLSALPLEDLRLLPPDYPKYMSNCDPLLLARNGDSVQVSSGDSATLNLGNRIVVDSNVPRTNGDMGGCNNSTDGIVMGTPRHGSGHMSVNEGTTGDMPSERLDHHIDSFRVDSDKPEGDKQNELIVNHTLDDSPTIPPTHETIEFITSEAPLEDEDDMSCRLKSVDEERDDDHVVHEDDDDDDDDVEPEVEMAQDGVEEEDDDDNLAMTNKSDLIAIDSRASSEENNYGLEYRPWRFEGAPKRSKRHGRTYRDNYLSIRRGNEVIRVGDSAELMPRDESILPFVAKIDGLWATSRGEMRVRVRWYYRLVETEGEPYDLKDGDNALFETDHFDENDVQSIYRSTKILSWTEYCQNYSGHVNRQSDRPKIFYLAGYYDPVRRIKHLRTDVKEAQ